MSASQPAIRPGSASALALKFLHNKGNREGSDTYRNLVQDARKSEESQHKSGISAINHYKS